MILISNTFFPGLNFYFSNGIHRLKRKNMNLSERENSHSKDLQTVNDQLREMTSAYLAAHPGLSLNALASRSGVAATTMRRLMQDQGGELAPHSVLALTSYLLREKRISALLKKVKGPVAELLHKSFNQFIFDEDVKHELDVDLNTLFQDRTCYLIYKLAANNGGTTTQEIKDNFGLNGLHKLQEMMDKSLIIAGDDESLHAYKKNFSVDLVLAHKLTHALIDFYKPHDVDKGLNLFYSLSEGMTEEGIKKIKEVELEAVKKIFNIMNDEQFQGKIPYFALVLSDILGLTPNQSVNSGVLQ